MKVIKICVGSSCHLKGSYEVIHRFQELLKEYQLEEEIELRAAFCLGQCTKAVSVMLPSGEVIAVSPDEVKQVLQDRIMKDE
ncbi:MAG: (2Fe-2S) ferredoxin domain-containing protein [Turicibacter sp.]